MCAEPEMPRPAVMVSSTVYGIEELLEKELGLLRVEGAGRTSAGHRRL